MSRRGWCVCLVGGWGRCWSRTGAWRTKPLDIDEAIQSFFRPWMLRARGVEARASKTGWGRRGWSSPPTGEEAVMLDPGSGTDTAQPGRLKGARGRAAQIGALLP